MSMYIHIDHNLSRFRRQVWGTSVRQLHRDRPVMAGGRSGEEAAHLAGMETSEWLAIEAGRVPQTAAELRSMAGALECGFEQDGQSGPALQGGLEVATWPPLRPSGLAASTQTRILTSRGRR